MLIFVGPWWLAWVGLAIGVIAFRYPYEYVLLALFSDALYGVVHEGALVPWSLLATSGALIAALCREWVISVIRIPSRL